jgi:8-oxo-dGTP diphosphatase
MTAYRNPSPCVDCIIQIGDRIVLIERKNPPYGWALPGGHVDYGESVEVAAVREDKEETGLDVTLTELFYVYSNPKRDPRQHIMTTVFLATATGVPVAADDAKDAGLFTCFDYPHLKDLPPLAFDHPIILLDFVRYLNDGTRPLQVYTDAIPLDK